jgi:hypothetical protein
VTAADRAARLAAERQAVIDAAIAKAPPATPEQVAAVRQSVLAPPVRKPA